MIKVVVYTAIFGDKDEEPEVLNVSFLKSLSSFTFDFVCVTDSHKMHSNIYDFIVVKPKFGDITKNAREIKISGFKGISDYDIAIWHDSSLMVDAKTLPDLITAAKSHILSSCLHDEVSIYSEARSCIRNNKDHPFRIVAQILYYSCFGKLPLPHKVYETTLLVMAVEFFKTDLSKLWWQHVRTMSRRDQISLPFVTHSTKTEIGILKGRGFDNPYSVYRGHKYYHYKSDNPILNLSTNWMLKISIWLIYRIEKHASRYNKADNINAL